MDIDELSKKIANSISEAKKIKRNGFVAFSVKRNSVDIKEFLDASGYKIPDLFIAVSLAAGEKPCAERSFRDLCNKYCTVDAAPKKKEENTTPKKGEEGEHSTNNGDTNIPSHTKEEVSDGGALRLDGLGDEWGEIIESLGPLKKQQLPEAIEAGLTIGVAKEARSKSIKALKEILTTYCMKRKL